MKDSNKSAKMFFRAAIRTAELGVIANAQLGVIANAFVVVVVAVR